MILDSERQRAVLLALIDDAPITGKHAEEVVILKNQIRTAPIATATAQPEAKEQA